MSSQAFERVSDVRRCGNHVPGTSRRTSATATRPFAATIGGVEAEERVETFTIAWNSHGEGMGHLVMEWEETRVEIPVHRAGMGHH